ncbi:MAG: hypothetical protein AAB019_01825 [Planctomycetota bacterium]
MVQHKEDFISFEDTLKELNLTEEELKQMIAEGEIRAFRDKDKMILKKEDVENFKKGRITEPTVMLPPDQIAPSLLDQPAGPEEAIFMEEQTSGITEEMAFGDTGITIPSLEEKSPAGGLEDQQTFIEEETGSPTTSLGQAAETEATFLDESPTDAGTDAVETVAEEFSETVAEQPLSVKPVSRRSSLAGPATVSQTPFSLPPKKIKTHPAFIITLAAALLFMVLTGSFLFDTVRISSQETTLPMGLTQEIGQLVLNIFGIKDVSLTHLK